MVDVIESCNFVMYVVRVRSVMMQQQQLYSSSVETAIHSVLLLEYGRLENA